MLLKQKVYISLILAIVVPLAVSTFLFSNSIQSHIGDKLAKVDLPTALSEVKSKIELELSTPIIVAKEIAQNLFVKQWLSNGESEQTQADYINYLASIKKDNKAVMAYIISKNTNNYYTDTGISRKIDRSEDLWFDQFLSSNKPFEIALDIDKTTNTMVVFINYALEIGGERTAITGVGRSLDSMINLINEYRIGEAGVVYLVSDDGEVMLHSDRDLMGQKININEIKNGAIVNKQIGDEDYVVSSTPIESLGWHLVAEIPENQLYGPINSAINSNLLFGVIIAIIGFVLARVLVAQIFKPIENITAAVNSLTKKDGDLTARLPTDDNNEISELAANFNLFLEQLHSMFKQVSDSANHVKSISESVLVQVQGAANLAEVQSSSTQTVAAAVNEMEVTVQDISNSASNASDIATTTEETTHKGVEFVNGTIKHMEQLETAMATSVASVTELSSEIKSITQVLDVIKAISEQTNLLALNAAIEAARAGEHGRGFAVVADEVRTLAMRTAESTEQINEMIDSLNTKASSTVSAIELGSKNTLENAERLKVTGSTLTGISQEIVTLSELNSSVATATREQTLATSEISQNVVMISDSAEQTKQNMKNSEQLCNGLNKESNILKELLGKFTL
ncbi:MULTISPECIES: methyl-accepting chemotaxis protein [Pseudoalteromonas]|uniref:Chemotaxis protein n=1 Tax=Pseudoalteromonas carrageenovora IAM 12662 TaxID=1314868 RepID=A0A2K4XCV0_PSEVC|nr:MULTISPECIES: methyl-accepting chemotaxis protein [Pseudoalteromonas]KTF11149.1 chemotaxis protein [Pseudoalteromonas sp. H103]MBE0381013.1 methyl-accepting chemotaxis protein [Pseudoalteromonas carrageenovora IAM 12662]MCQ8891153.1 methyl-accepting chemotaxis protein [Pseudoalteromonas carrageenovora]MDO6464905.1 methyl-accepting chemotaxis protein [Pseudoalteromonas carrageenovora]QBJ73027.1 Methyl-accepting chemotaxis transducer [Pseudoalteromonas carrageenovora]